MQTQDLQSKKLVFLKKVLFKKKKIITKLNFLEF